MKQLRSLAYFIATFGLIGKLPGARWWASLFGLPILFLGRMGYQFSPGLFWVIMISGLLFSAGVSLYARINISEEEEEAIVLDRALGLLLALSFLPVLTIKLMLFGTVIFHSWLALSIFLQERYVRHEEMAAHQIILGTGEILLVALLTNILLRSLWWIMN